MKLFNSVAQILEVKKTAITQILLDMRVGLKKKVKGNPKTNFTAKGAVMEFEYEDGEKYRITVESL